VKKYSNNKTEYLSDVTWNGNRYGGPAIPQVLLLNRGSLHHRISYASFSIGDVEGAENWIPFGSLAFVYRRTCEFNRSWNEACVLCASLSCQSGISTFNVFDAYSDSSPVRPLQAAIARVFRTGQCVCSKRYKFQFDVIVVILSKGPQYIAV
jgi:hypothetical protein